MQPADHQANCMPGFASPAPILARALFSCCFSICMQHNALCGSHCHAWCLALSLDGIFSEAVWGWRRCGSNGGAGANTSMVHSTLEFDVLETAWWQQLHRRRWSPAKDDLTNQDRAFWFCDTC